MVVEVKATGIILTSGKQSTNVNLDKNWSM